jgi:hypothetical protein
MDYIYDIRQFYWNKEANTFFSDAAHLVAELGDATFHPESFPNQKGKFTIKNYQTENFRVFTFVDETREKLHYPFEDGDYEIVSTHWNFISEDGIKASICID